MVCPAMLSIAVPRGVTIMAPSGALCAPWDVAL